MSVDQYWFPTRNMDNDQTAESTIQVPEVQYLKCDRGLTKKEELKMNNKIWFGTAYGIVVHRTETIKLVRTSV